MRKKSGNKSECIKILERCRSEGVLVEHIKKAIRVV